MIIFSKPDLYLIFSNKTTCVTARYRQSLKKPDYMISFIFSFDASKKDLPGNFIICISAALSLKLLPDIRRIQQINNALIFSILLMKNFLTFKCKL